jgi:hypothetical protein
MEHFSGLLSAEDIRKTEMYKRGDCIQIWVHEGDFLHIDLEIAQKNKEIELLKCALVMLTARYFADTKGKFNMGNIPTERLQTIFEKYQSNLSLVEYYGKEKSQVEVILDLLK